MERRSMHVTASSLHNAVMAISDRNPITSTTRYLQQQENSSNFNHRIHNKSGMQGSVIEDTLGFFLLIKPQGT